MSDAERDVLKALWEAGTATVRDLHERLTAERRQWAYTTVLTFLMRLEAKGYVRGDKSGVAHVYRPVVSRDDLLRRKVASLADELCDGAATPLVRALVEGRRFSPEEIAGFRRLLDELEQPAADRTAAKRPRKR